MMAWLKKYMSWKVIGGAVAVFGLVLVRLWHNWQRSKQADLEGAARAAERRRMRDMAEGQAAGHGEAAAQANERAEAARKRAEAFKEKADQTRGGIEEIERKKTELIDEAKKYHDADSIDAWARRLGY